MAVFSHIPLGQRIPAKSLHAVSCSLPTMRDVIGYEENDPEVRRQMTSGYPRFVKHPFLRQTAETILRALGLKGYQLWPTSSYRAAVALKEWLVPAEAEVVTHERLCGVAFKENAETFGRAKVFLQHTGMLLSSREAEDYLVRAGELPEAQLEATFDGYAVGRVKGVVGRAYRHVSAEDVFVSNSGMNAVYSTFRIASQIQKTRGRRIWVQLGWLYLDTIAIMEKFVDDPKNDYVFVNDVFDLAALRALFSERGQEIAGVITEVPTNPLIQTTDLPALYELCRAHGVFLMVDPTIASPQNIDVLSYADVAVNSLTKFFASEGDVIAGSVVLNAQSAFAAELRQRLPGELEPVYSRDLDHLAAQIGDYDGVIAQINRSAPVVVEFLLNHPKVHSVFWSEHPASKENYRRLARTPGSIGSMVTFSVRGPLAEFYDRLRLPKGPSFGMKSSLVCPFIFLAHYGLVTTDEGQAHLRANGIDPELLRLSIGCEPVEEIVAALAEALS